IVILVLIINSSINIIDFSFVFDVGLLFLYLFGCLFGMLDVRLILFSLRYFIIYNVCTGFIVTSFNSHPFFFNRFLNRTFAVIYQKSKNPYPNSTVLTGLINSGMD